MDTTIDMMEDVGHSMSIHRRPTSLLRSEIDGEGRHDDSAMDERRRLNAESGWWSLLAFGWLQEAYCMTKPSAPVRALQYRRRKMKPLELPLATFQIVAIL